MRATNHVPSHQNEYHHIAYDLSETIAGRTSVKGKFKVTIRMNIKMKMIKVEIIKMKTIIVETMKIKPDGIIRTASE